MGYESVDKRAAARPGGATQVHALLNPRSIVILGATDLLRQNGGVALDALVVLNDQRSAK